MMGTGEAQKKGKRAKGQKRKREKGKKRKEGMEAYDIEAS